MNNQILMNNAKKIKIINAFDKAYSCKILIQFVLDCPPPPFVIDWLSNNYTITTTTDK